MLKMMFQNALGSLMKTLGIVKRSGGHGRYKMQNYSGPISFYYSYVWRLCRGYGRTQTISLARIYQYHGAQGAVHHTIKQP